MNIRTLCTQGLLAAALAAGALPLAAGQAAAADNAGCGAGFTESTVYGLATYAAGTYGGTTDWTTYLSGLDHNGDGWLCWHPIGKDCPCGADAINIVDDNASATATNQ